MQGLKRGIAGGVLVLLVQGLHLGHLSEGAQAAAGRHTPGPAAGSAEVLQALQHHAARGMAEAQLELGRMYLQGDGVARDADRAVHWIRRAADQGLADAQVRMGWLHDEGIGLRADAMQAAAWYRRAAEQGDAWGQNNLAAMHLVGNGVAADLPQALRLFHQAAEQGLAAAQFNLGRLRTHDLPGQPRDTAAARHWLGLAAAQGHGAAQELLRQLASATPTLR